MLYYIIKVYEHKQKEADLKLGLNRFSKGMKATVISLFVAMVVFFSVMMVLLLFVPDSLWFLLGAIPYLLVLFTLFALDNYICKIDISQYVDEYKKKTDILYNIIKNDFSMNMDCIEKIDILISEYQRYIDKCNADEQKQNKIIGRLFTGLSGVLSISFINKLETIGINFWGWFGIAMFSLLLFGFFTASIYFYRKFGTSKQKYESLITDLVYVKLHKY